MRVPLRETGSILVRAREDEVLDILRRQLGDAALVAPGRLESARGRTVATYVVRKDAGGTRVVHARSEDAPVALGRAPREELRRQVEADLFQLQRLVDATRGN